MLVTENQHKGPPPPFTDVASSSSDFQDGGSTSENTHLLLDFSESASEAPPPFAPYEAEFFESGQSVVSHDTHLNNDGEALYRFLLSQSTRPPGLEIRIRGTHEETEWRNVTTRDNGGRSTTRRERTTRTVVDFDFNIRIPVQPQVTHWSVADSDPAYRGSMTKEVQVGFGRHRAKKADRRAFERFLEETSENGLPPWNPRFPNSDSTPLRSSKTLREWADEYCLSDKYMKEFLYEKQIYGWNLKKLELAVRSSIVASFYQGDIQVDFVKTGSKIYIRPDNRLSRMLSNKWLKFLLWILLMYPFIWLLKRFYLGGRWEVCGGAYALKRMVPADQVPEADQLPRAQTDSPKPIAALQRDGTLQYTVGISESQWLRRWQTTIVQAVQSHYQASIPLVAPADERLESIPNLLEMNV
ncbi:hypothetical protein C8J56DRAFT_918930 [Mycena floridula]|nr:hypothetical protein C8J56DRAFT_918930 [Mycena floridula]